MQLGELHRGACGQLEVSTPTKALERRLPVATRLVEAVVHEVDEAVEIVGRRIAVRLDQRIQARPRTVDVARPQEFPRG